MCVYVAYICVWGGTCGDPYQPQVLVLRIPSFFFLICVYVGGVGWVCVQVVVTSSVTLYHISEIETLTQPGACLFG